MKADQLSLVYFHTLVQIELNPIVSLLQAFKYKVLKDSTVFTPKANVASDSLDAFNKGYRGCIISKM